MKTSRGERLIMTLVGRRNVGKSSLINAFIGQDVSIVSEEAGTTTDAIRKSYELLPLGPVSFYDTAGIDDVGELGEKRVKATRKILWRTDISLIVVDDKGITNYDRKIIKEIEDLKIPFVLVFNKIDVKEPSEKDIEFCRKKGIKFGKISAQNSKYIDELKEILQTIVPNEFKAEKVLIGDLVNPGDVVLLIAPIDQAAPKGRLILPQVQVLREILDNDAVGMIVKDKEIEQALIKLDKKPDLVITDSQVVLKVVGDIPQDVYMTTFSVLFARYKGDLEILEEGCKKIDKLENGDKILIAEACSHHVQCDDIGRVKIPRWLQQYTGKNLEYDVVAGHDFPEDLEKYDLVVHCGGCMLNKTAMNRRIKETSRRGVSITNYGIAISKIQGVLDRAMNPFRKKKNSNIKSLF